MYLNRHVVEYSTYMNYSTICLYSFNTVQYVCTIKSKMLVTLMLNNKLCPKQNFLIVKLLLVWLFSLIPSQTYISQDWLIIFLFYIAINLTLTTHNILQNIPAIIFKFFSSCTLPLHETFNYMSKIYLFGFDFHS